MQPEQIMLGMIEMFRTGDFSRLDILVSPTYIDHQEGSEIAATDGRTTFRRVVNRVRSHCPDLSVQARKMIAEGDHVMAHLAWTGTNAYGERFEAESMDLLRISGGRAREHWGIGRGWPEA